MKASSVKKSFFSTLVLFGLLSIFNTSVHAVISPGSACNPATLGQAQKLGFTTNQFGVSNPEASTSNFFVVCPIHSELGVTYSDVVLGGEFTDTAGGEIDCIIRLANVNNGNLNATPLTVSSLSAGYSQNNVAITINTGVQTNSTIVCALAPGETVIWYALVDV